ncbi:MAG: DUF222 domain-containing protein, partial [Actinomycetota bacterium]
MKTTTAPTSSSLSFEEMTTDALEQVALSVEASIAQGRALQMGIIRELDRRQIHTGDGCRSMVEWVTGRLDISSDTAKKLVSTAKRLETLPTVTAAAQEGTVTFDRTWAVAK